MIWRVSVARCVARLTIQVQTDRAGPVDRKAAAGRSPMRSVKVGPTWKPSVRCVSHADGARLRLRRGPATRHRRLLPTVGRARTSRRCATARGPSTAGPRHPRRARARAATRTRSTSRSGAVARLQPRGVRVLPSMPRGRDCVYQPRNDDGAFGAARPARARSGHRRPKASHRRRRRGAPSTRARRSSRRSTSSGES